MASPTTTFEPGTFIHEFAETLIRRQGEVTGTSDIGVVDVNADGVVTEEEVITATFDYVRDHYEDFIDEAANLEKKLEGGYPTYTSTPQTLRILYKIAEVHRNIRRDHPDLPLGSDDYQKELARCLFDYLRNSKGLGIESVTLNEEQNAKQTIESKRGQCSELSYTLLKIYQLAGLKAVALLVLIDHEGRSLYGENSHMGVGLLLGDKAIYVDPSYGQFDIQHKKVIPILPDQLIFPFQGNKQAAAPTSQSDQLPPSYLTDADLYYQQGLEAKEKGDFAVARSLFQKAIFERPDFLEARLELGQVLYNHIGNGIDDEEELAMATEAVSILRGAIHDETHGHAQQIKDRALAAGLEERFLIRAAKYYIIKGDQKQSERMRAVAKVAFENQQSLYDPEDPELIEEIGHRFFEEGKWQEAAQEYCRALRNNSLNRGVIYLKLALAYFYLGDIGQAKSAFQNGLNQNPHTIWSIIGHDGEFFHRAVYDEKTHSRYHYVRFVEFFKTYFPNDIHLKVFQGEILEETEGKQAKLQFYKHLLKRLEGYDKMYAIVVMSVQVDDEIRDIFYKEYQRQANDTNFLRDKKIQLVLEWMADQNNYVDPDRSRIYYAALARVRGMTAAEDQ